MDPNQVTILLVATEWASRHGGLSTFNRELCCALAGIGTRVVCFVPEATQVEIADAKTSGVELALPQRTKASGYDRLTHPPVVSEDFFPDAVVGHDRVTGEYAVDLAARLYPEALKVLFIHTSPEQIEWEKGARDGVNPAETAETRRKVQVELGAACDLVVPVGPLLYREYLSELAAHCREKVPKAHMMIPGMATDKRGSSLPGSLRCLVLGRAEDYHLKGLDIAAKCLGYVITKWRERELAPQLVVRGAPPGQEVQLRDTILKDAGCQIDCRIRTYTPMIEEIKGDILASSLVLMPSRAEGFGLVGLEAIALGVPTLITANSGLAVHLRDIAPKIAPELIVSTGDDAIADWGTRAYQLLAAQEGAFARARDIRDSLLPRMQWKESAEQFISALPLRPERGVLNPAIMVKGAGVPGSQEGDDARLRTYVIDGIETILSAKFGPWLDLLRRIVKMPSRATPREVAEQLVGLESLSAFVLLGKAAATKVGASLRPDLVLDLLDYLFLLTLSPTLVSRLTAGLELTEKGFKEAHQSVPPLRREMVRYLVSAAICPQDPGCVLPPSCFASPQGAHEQGPDPKAVREQILDDAYAGLDPAATIEERRAYTWWLANKGQPVNILTDQQFYAANEMSQLVEIDPSILLLIQEKGSLGTVFRQSGWERIVAIYRDVYTAAAKLASEDKR